MYREEEIRIGNKVHWVRQLRAKKKYLFFRNFDRKKRVTGWVNLWVGIGAIFLT
jgi:hypothetical protein